MNKIILLLFILLTLNLVLSGYLFIKLNRQEAIANKEQSKETKDNLAELIILSNLFDTDSNNSTTDLARLIAVYNIFSKNNPNTIQDLINLEKNE